MEFTLYALEETTFMDEALDTVLRSLTRCQEEGPHRTMINDRGHCCSSGGAKHDFVLVRDDGHTLGVRVEWLEFARHLVKCQGRWIGLLKLDRSLNNYHRVW